MFGSSHGYCPAHPPGNVGAVLQEHLKDLDIATLGQVVDGSVAFVISHIDERDCQGRAHQREVSRGNNGE